MKFHFKEKKNNLVDKITKAEKDSAANDVKITETGKKRVEIETKIAELKKQLSNNSAQIQNLTASAQKSTKDFYQAEIVKFQTQISQLEKQLTQTGESINTTTTTISTTKITVTTKTECISQNSNNVQKYTAEYTKLSKIMLNLHSCSNCHAKDSVYKENNSTAISYGDLPDDAVIFKHCTNCDLVYYCSFQCHLNQKHSLFQFYEKFILKC